MPKDATIGGSTAVARSTAPIRVLYSSHQVAKIAATPTPKTKSR